MTSCSVWAKHPKSSKPPSLMAFTMFDALSLIIKCTCSGLIFHLANILWYSRDKTSPVCLPGSGCACSTASFFSNFLMSQCTVRLSKQSLLTSVLQISVVKLYHSTHCNSFLTLSMTPLTILGKIVSVMYFRLGMV